MLLMGDEERHSRNGNNNPWCQNNERNWFNWDLVQENAGLLQFTKNLIGLARNLDSLTEDRFWSATSPEKKGDITWHGLQPGKPDWRPESHCIGFSLAPGTDAQEVLVLYNASSDEQEFNLPNESGTDCWTVVINTAQKSPSDFNTQAHRDKGISGKILLPNKSSLVLLKT